MNPPLLTPGAAEALSVKIYRLVRTSSLGPEDAVCRCLDGYRSPVPRETLEFQIRLAVHETSDPQFVPAQWVTT